MSAARESATGNLPEYRSSSNNQVYARLNMNQEPKPIFATRYYRNEKTTTNMKSLPAARIRIFRVRSQHAAQEIPDRPELPTGEQWQNRHPPPARL
ncbi:MAG: hypothetical protein ACI8P0_001568 [Planctomycetaceae bacterium]